MSFALVRPNDRKVAQLIEYRTPQGDVQFKKVFRKKAPLPVRKKR